MRGLAVALVVACTAEGSADAPITRDAALETAVADARVDTAQPDDDEKSDALIFPVEDAAEVVDAADACAGCVSIAFTVGDCGTVTCPAAAPHPIGCNINFVGEDPRGCVVHTPGSSKVGLKLGSACSPSVSIKGVLRCGTAPGKIDLMSCPTNRTQYRYVTSASGCW